MKKKQYWYQIYRVICDECGRKVHDERKRVYASALATKTTATTPMCNDCFRTLKGV